MASGVIENESLHESTVTGTATANTASLSSRERVLRV